MTKTLDEIINRNDYVRLNNALIERAQELAKIIRTKMDELDEESITVNNVTISSESVHSSRNGFTEYFLAISVYEEDYGWVEHSLETRGSYYACANDFKCKITGASSAEYLKFLNNTRAIMDALDEIETEKCKDIENALESAKEL